jgi:hypothetical protein
MPEVEPIGTIGEPEPADPFCEHPAPLRGLDIIFWRGVLFCPSCEQIVAVDVNEEVPL